MSSNRTRRAMEIFDQLCDLSDAERTVALEEACGDDHALRQRLEDLL